MQKRITIAPQSPLVTQSQSKGKGCSAKKGEITLGVRPDNRFADDLIFAHRETLCNQVVMLPCFDFHAFFILLVYGGIFGAFTLAIGGGAFPLSFSKVFLGKGQFMSLPAS